MSAITIKLDEHHTICFDTDLMRWAGAWTGGFLDLSQTHQVLLKGTLATLPDRTLVRRIKVKKDKLTRGEA